MIKSNSALSTAAFAAGGILLSLIFMDRSFGLPFAMPPTWYVNSTLWAFLAVALIPIGWIIGKSSAHIPHVWAPTQPGIRFQRVVVYTKADCPLCDEAKIVLAEYAEYLPAVQELDIAGEPALFERFATVIPVVECDDQVRFRGRINEFLLRRLIEGTHPV